MVLQYGTRARHSVLKATARICLIVILAAACYALFAPVTSPADLVLERIQPYWPYVVGTGFLIVATGGILTAKERVQ